MIREVCSCGAEIETDLPEQLEIVKNWRRTHKHATEKPATKDSSILSNTESTTLGFRPEHPVFNDGEEL